MELRLLLIFFLNLLLAVSSNPLYYKRILRRDDEPFNLLGQAQAPLDDYDSTAHETWIEDNPPPESSFRLIETPVCPFFKKIKRFSGLSLVPQTCRHQDLSPALCNNKLLEICVESH